MYRNHKFCAQCYNPYGEMESASNAMLKAQVDMDVVFVIYYLEEKLTKTNFRLFNVITFMKNLHQGYPLICHFHLSHCWWAFALQPEQALIWVAIFRSNLPLTQKFGCPYFNYFMRMWAV